MAKEIKKLLANKFTIDDILKELKIERRQYFWIINGFEND